MKDTIIKDFLKYVSLNVLGMIGLSCYILADTFFESKALGATGIAALNLSISIFSIINGVGLMLGIGGATRYSILQSQKEFKRANDVFTTSIKMGLILGIVFLIIGLFASDGLAILLGANYNTFPLTKTYLMTILCFAPFFILNNIIIAFVRNDHKPKLAMIAMLSGSIANIFLDYIFMFPLDMGMFGAAFATSLAPIIGIAVSSIHFIKGKNSLSFTRCKITLSRMVDIVVLGLSAFINEISSAITLITFNLLILTLEGNLGVASYGIIANLALIGMAIFNGVAQGIQPLVSKGYGQRNEYLLKKVHKTALITALAIATIIYVITFAYSDGIIRIFNSEGSMEIARMSKIGLRIYFLGFFFAGINIIVAMYLSATESAKDAFLISIARGCVIIIPMVLLLSKVWDMTGIWLAFVATEVIVAIYSIYRRGRINY
ncbi:MAG TPA: MATE family efflux transporter [Clostridiales bacterium]|nr:MATE family efflux transporter [Clostridiales bacterium]